MKSSIYKLLATTILCIAGASIAQADIFGSGVVGTGGAGIANIEFNQANGTNGVFTSDITVNADIKITDIKVKLLNLKHTWSGDLVIQLSKIDGFLGSDPAHPTPLTITLVHRVGSINGTFGAPNPFGKWTGAINPDFTGLVGDDYTFANAGANIWTTALGLDDPLKVITGGTYQTSGQVTTPGAPWGANTSLTSFNNFNSRGLWKLTITDMSSPNEGSLGGWQLDIIPSPGALAILTFGLLVPKRRHR